MGRDVRGDEKTWTCRTPGCKRKRACKDVVGCEHWCQSHIKETLATFRDGWGWPRLIERRSQADAELLVRAGERSLRRRGRKP